MPRAGGSIVAPVKYAYEDHDSDRVFEEPPTQDTWYTVFDAEDVRLLWCQILQWNVEAAAKTVHVKFTIDGTVYHGSLSLPHDSDRWVYRDHMESAGGTQGLDFSETALNAAWHADKRGKSFKVTVMMSTLPGTDQTLECQCVRETLEET